MQGVAQQHKVIEVAKETCLKVLKDLSDGEGLEANQYRGVNLNDVQLHFRRNAWVFDHWRFDYSYLHTQIGVYTGETNAEILDLEFIAEYHLFTTLDGESVDDELEWHDVLYNDEEEAIK